MTNEKAIYFLDKRKKELLEKQDSKEGFEFIKALAEIRSLEMAIKALETQPSEDCISRQAVLGYAKDTCLDLDKYEDTEIFCDEIKALPTITPQPKKGKWIVISCEPTDIFKCSECGMRVINPYRYCHSCGTKMEVDDGQI